MLESGSVGLEETAQEECTARSEDGGIGVEVVEQDVAVDVGDD